MKKNWAGKADTPKGYPGWSGTWKGQVKVVDKDRWSSPPYFSDVIGSWSGNSNNFPRVRWINTGSGGGGDTFHYSGMLFLYDFPLMHKQFKQNGEEFKVLEKDYDEAVDNYHKKFLSEREYFVAESSSYKEVLNLRKQLQETLKGVESAITKTRIHLQGNFVEQYDVDIPKPTSIFVNDEKTMSAAVDTGVSKTPHPELEKTYTYTKDLADRLSAYVNNNPEVFI